MDEQIRLPAPSKKGKVSLEEAIVRRRSVRDFAPEPISIAQLSQMLWVAGGLIDAASWRRTIPSANATYPLEIFFVCGRNCVEGLEEGVYHYNVDEHSLTVLQKVDARLTLARVAFDQEFIYQAPLDIVICADYERIVGRYGNRGERYVNMEVGHAGQNIYLQATALGLGTVAVGAFYDEQVREVLGLEKQFKPLYIMPVGKPGS